MTEKVPSLSPGRGTLTNKWVPKPKPIFHFKLCRFYDDGGGARKNTSCPRAQVTLATPLSSNPKKTAKSYTTLQTVRHRFNIYAGNSVTLPSWRYDAEISLHAPA